MKPVFSEHTCPAHTPWGARQHQQRLAPGLWLVSTAGHGGVFMSPERRRQFRALFPGFEGYAGLPWLEEDLDCSLAMLAFAEELMPESVFHAVEAVLTYKSGDGIADYYFRQPRLWLLSPAGELARQIAAGFSATRTGLWRRGGCGSKGTGWLTFWSRGQERTTTQTKDYISENWLPDEFIQAHRQPEQPVAPLAPVVVLPPAKFAPAFNEADCGGVYDGFCVTSDADPGL